MLINGTPGPVFGSSRGIRQGDPMSPYLFFIVMERLSRRIFLEEVRGSIISCGVRSFNWSYFFYADDALFGFRDKSRSVENFVKVIKDFEAKSGLLVRDEKSIMIPFQLRSDRVAQISQVCHWKVEKLPIKYLGFPIFVGRLKKEM